jgi:hypothetical protein
VGVDDQTWELYMQELQEQGVQVLDGVTTAKRIMPAVEP